MSTFTYTPNYGAKKDQKPKVTNIKFGDGYQQRASFGLNQNPEVWSLTFANRDETESDGIESFLSGLAGVTSFDWIPPDSDTAGKYICQAWTRTVVNFNLFTITATFEQVFEP